MYSTVSWRLKDILSFALFVLYSTREYASACAAVLHWMEDGWVSPGGARWILECGRSVCRANRHPQVWVDYTTTCILAVDTGVRLVRDLNEPFHLCHTPFQQTLDAPHAEGCVAEAAGQVEEEECPTFLPEGGIFWGTADSAEFLEQL